ncbi:hypothetical protein AHAS_Ahas02G0087100 [Arachis hypogaea]
MYDRLLNMAGSALTESSSKSHPIHGLNHISRHLYENHVQIKMLNIIQICNAVAVASLLNATLVMPNQFGDIYQEDYFMNILKDDIRIVKELPPHMKSQDLNAVGSQRLRCKCNFYALKFAPKIQQAGSLLIKRIRQYSTPPSMLDTQLLWKLIEKESHEYARGSTKYLALHLRFEIDMVAYSLCEFGGGKNERKELQAYRESHFPLLLQRLKNSTYA